MYSHCLFCNASLGANESIEAFQVGKRLAFDAEKGRLWVVCPKCHRWNLTPLEARWEAIEQCERLYRDQRLREQTDNIGMAKTRDGTELVRIGPAPRVELAAWRYGREFGQRRRRTMMVAAGGAALMAVGAAAVVPGAAIVLGAAAPVLFLAGHVALITSLGLYQTVPMARVVGEDGKLLNVTRVHLERTYLLGGEGNDPFRLELRHSMGKQVLTGERARRAMGAILARVNRWGAPTKHVQDATSLLAEAGTPERAAAIVARESQRLAGDFEAEWKDAQKFPFKSRPSKAGFRSMNRGNLGTVVNPGALPRLSAEQRLALEMALHEDSERAAMEGELAVLEAHWREAEEIAAIVDGQLTELPRSNG